MYRCVIIHDFCIDLKLYIIYIMYKVTNINIVDIYKENKQNVYTELLNYTYY